MPELRSCQACGSLVPQDAPEAHCPTCLLDLGFGLPADDPPSVSPRRFGEYELLELIGRGGMGVVYKARQVSLKRLVALKMLSPHAAAFPGIAERLQLEAEAAGSLCHPLIVTIHGVGEHEGQPFFTMELIEGQGLDRFIRPDGFQIKPVTPENSEDGAGSEKVAVRLMIQIARAVDHAHQHGVLHRDLKPANILIDAEGQPHLTDFGLAKVMGRVATAGTASGAIMGTPAYMAPEQASGATKHASTAADVYSLGAILYAMLTGRPPFRAETPLETLRQVVVDLPKPPSTFNRKVDGDLAIICLKCLEKDPQHRYHSALALAEDLERWRRGEPIEARSVPPLERLWRWCRRQPVLAGLLGGLLLLLTAVALLALALYQRARTQVEREQAEKEHQKKVLIDRIDQEWLAEDRAFVRISPKEVAMLARLELKIDGSERLVVVGYIPRVRKPDEAILQIAPLVNYLRTNNAMEARPSLLFELHIYKARSHAMDALLNGQIDMMRVDPGEYVLIRAKTNNVLPVARLSYANEAEQRAAVFARADSGLTRIEDLAGRLFAFGESNAALGDHLAKAALANAGLRAVDLKGLTNLRSVSVIHAVRTNAHGPKPYDAGVADWDDFVNATNLGVSLVLLRELRCPNDPWLARTSLEPTVREVIRAKLLSLRNTDALLPFDPKLTGFHPVLPSDYDSVEVEMKKANQFEASR